MKKQQKGKVTEGLFGTGGAKAIARKLSKGKLAESICYVWISTALSGNKSGNPNITAARSPNIHRSYGQTLKL
ncbi:hypothetical protein [Paenibacillus sp. sgz500958]|uniref:hypothetical protein n=1 Tax=Paenibacillus sp. sgz500958 TaxID=3242475 RepID=UPI0036D415B5